MIPFLFSSYGHGEHERRLAFFADARKGPDTPKSETAEEALARREKEVQEKLARLEDLEKQIDERLQRNENLLKSGVAPYASGNGNIFPNSLRNSPLLQVPGSMNVATRTGIRNGYGFVPAERPFSSARRAQASALNQPKLTPSVAPTQPTIIIQPTIAPVQPRRRTRYERGGRGFYEELYDPVTGQSLEGTQNTIRTTADVQAEGYARYLARERYFAEKEARYAAAGHILKAYNEGGRDQTVWRQMERDQRVAADPTLRVDPMRNAPRAVHRANAEYAARMNAFDAYAATGVPRMEQMGTRTEVVGLMSLPAQPINRMSDDIYSPDFNPNDHAWRMLPRGQEGFVYAKGTDRNVYAFNAGSNRLMRYVPSKYTWEKVTVNDLVTAGIAPLSGMPSAPIPPSAGPREVPLRMADKALEDMLAKEKAKYNDIPDDRAWHTLATGLGENGFAYAKGADGKMYAHKAGQFQVFEQFAARGPAWIRVTPAQVGSAGLPLSIASELPLPPQPVLDPDADKPVLNPVPVPENPDHIVPAPAPFIPPASSPEPQKTRTDIPRSSQTEKPTGPAKPLETINGIRDRAVEKVMNDWKIPKDLRTQPYYKKYTDVMTWNGYELSDGQEKYTYRAFKKLEKNGNIFLFYAMEGKAMRGAVVDSRGEITTLLPGMNTYFDAFNESSVDLLRSLREQHTHDRVAEKKKAHDAENETSPAPTLSKDASSDAVSAADALGAIPTPEAEYAPADATIPGNAERLPDNWGSMVNWLGDNIFKKIRGAKIENEFGRIQYEELSQIAELKLQDKRTLKVQFGNAYPSADGTMKIRRVTVVPDKELELPDDVFDYAAPGNELPLMKPTQIITFLEDLLYPAGNVEKGQRVDVPQEPDAPAEALIPENAYLLEDTSRGDVQNWLGDNIFKKISDALIAPGQRIFWDDAHRSAGVELGDGRWLEVTFAQGGIPANQKMQIRTVKISQKRISSKNARIVTYEDADNQLPPMTPEQIVIFLERLLHPQRKLGQGKKNDAPPNNDVVADADNPLRPEYFIKELQTIFADIKNETGQECKLSDVLEENVNLENAVAIAKKLREEIPRLSDAQKAFLKERTIIISSWVAKPESFLVFHFTGKMYINSTWTTKEVSWLLRTKIDETIRDAKIKKMEADWEYNTDVSSINLYVKSDVNINYENAEKIVQFLQENIPTLSDGQKKHLQKHGLDITDKTQLFSLYGSAISINGNEKVENMSNILKKLPTLDKNND